MTTSVLIIASRSLCRRPCVCRLSVCLSVTFVHSTQAIEIFGNVFTPFGTLAICWHPDKVLRRSSQGNPPSGELNTTGAAEYSDFGPIEHSRKRCKIGAKLLLITNRKSHMGFRLIPNSVTVDDLEQRNSPNRSVISPNSVAFGGGLRKSG